MEIENLSNKELHTKIVEWGLPNIPVTDSNRNVLIKRLINAMDENKKSNKDRRKTVAITNANRDKVTPKSPTLKPRTSGKSPVVSHEFDELSNKEIQKMCLQYELPNIPVTDSNRNVLLRRLQKAMDDAKNDNKRRHTIAAASSSTDEILKRNEAHQPNASQHISRSNVRRTITSAIDATPSPSPRRVSPSHRHVVTTTAVDASPSPPTVRRNQFVAPVTVRANHNFLPPLFSEQDKSRRERSISLSKTGVLTTSYSQETSSMSEHMEVDEPEEESAFEVDINKRSGGIGNSSYSTLYDNNYSSNNYTFAKPYELSTKPTTTSTYEPFFAQPKKPLLESTLSTGSSSTRYSNLYPKLDASLHPDNMNLNQSYSKSYLSKQSPSNYNEYSYKGFNNDASEFSSDDQIDKPYLSGYTRTSSSSLNRRSVGNPLNSYEVAAKKRRSTVQRHSTATGVQYEDDEDSPFRQFLVTMDRKYHLRQALVLISIFVLTVFIYVFFIQQ